MTEQHRTATPLELFYDLASVVAIASTAGLLHHSLSENHIVDGVLLYFMTFWTIWWAWMNFTWHASAYDTDDTPYRVAVFIQITGALVMAAGIDRMFVDLEFKFVSLGFVIMRLPLVVMWLRTAHRDPRSRPAALRYAIGITLCQVGWAILVFLLPKSLLIPGFFVLLICEHSVPIIAESAVRTKWHRAHIIERYGLLTIIVLGEAILASYTGLQAFIKQPEIPLLSVLVGGVLILFSMWWLYFDEDEHVILQTLRGAFAWAYGHFVVFASVAAVGAGLSLVTDKLVKHTRIPLLVAHAAVLTPVALYLIALWLLHKLPARHKGRNYWLFPVGSVCVLISLMSPSPVLIAGLVMCALVILNSTKMRTTQ
jgi:low temperature requirement protein LtrA